MDRLLRGLIRAESVRETRDFVASLLLENTAAAKIVRCFCWTNSPEFWMLWEARPRPL